MGLLNNKRTRYEFYPNCEPVLERTNSNVREMDCNIKERFGSDEIVVEKPVRVAFSDGDIIVTKTGGASTRQADQLVKYLKKKICPLKAIS